MSFGTYSRLGMHVDDSNMMVIRAVRRRLTDKAKTRNYRTRRFRLYREMIRYHAAAKALFKEYRF